jgi:EpsI family protein
MKLDDWEGTALVLEKQYIEALRLDDYVLADYRTEDGLPINFYSAYYRSQKKGRSVHSPQSCLPGGGWEIASLSRVALPVASTVTPAFLVNRALIQKGDQRQVVMYWFKQRDRILADEFLVRLYMFWDAVLRKRTDGALVRIASPVGPGETEDTVDKRLRKFAGLVQMELPRYVPD